MWRRLRTWKLWIAGYVVAERVPPLARQTWQATMRDMMSVVVPGYLVWVLKVAVDVPDVAEDQSFFPAGLRMLLILLKLDED